MTYSSTSSESLSPQSSRGLTFITFPLLCLVVERAACSYIDKHNPHSELPQPIV